MSNVVSVKGGKTHLGNPDSPVPFPLCGSGSRNTATKFRHVDTDVDCKECSGILARRAEAAEAKESNEMAAKTLDEVNEETRDEIRANIERVRSLAEAENEDGAKDLHKETTALIKRLPADERPALTKALKAAGQAQPKAAEVVKAESPASLETQDYKANPEIVALVELGTKKIVAGVQQQMTARETARQVAELTLDMWRRITTKNGVPDLKGDTDQAKQAAKDMYSAVGPQLEGDEYDVEQAVNKLVRSVQDHRSDVRAVYLRGLDDAPEEREKFQSILGDKPDDVPVSKWVADYYKLSLVGQIEANRERARKNRELAKQAKDSAELEQGDAEPKAEETAEEKVARTLSGMHRALRGIRQQDFASLSDERKEEVRAEVEDLNQIIKNILAAVL
jgi:hypothetical protein